MSKTINLGGTSGVECPDISVILPTYNEGENVNDLIFELKYYLQKYVKKTVEFIVVDDDSPDKTWEIVARHYAPDSGVKVIHRTDQKGLASAISRGIQESKGNIVAWLDCDFSMLAYKLAELVNKIYAGYDIAVGSRFIKGGKDVRGPTESWTAVILSWIMNHFIAFVLRHSFNDYTSGFVAVRRSVFEKIKITGDYGEYFIDFIYSARRMGYRIVEIPYYCLPRRTGTSKTGDSLVDYLKRGWKYILLTLDCKFRKV